MTLDELESFVCIATGGGYAHAAQVLHRSQPAISRRIAALEHSLGAPLFERDGRTVQLTAAGQALLPHAETVLSALHDARAAVRSARDTRSAPSLRLAIVGTLADVHIVQALQHFRAKHGKSSLSMRTATSREVSALVRRGEADIGVRYRADPDAKLESIALGAERLFVVLPANHPQRAARVRDLRAFAEDKWLAFPPDPRRPGSAGELYAHLVAAGLPHPEISYVDSLTAQKRLVEAGFGLALLPASSFREELKHGSLRTIEVERLHVEQPVVAVRRKNTPSPVHNDFLELLKQCTPELLGRRKARLRRS